jgi:hypothetical protein
VFRHPVRIKPEACVGGKDSTGNRLDYPAQKGMKVLLKGVKCLQEGPVAQSVVIRWPGGLPKDRDKPWFLVTDWGRSVTARAGLYGKRMAAEEVFGGGKNKRDGLAPRDTKTTKWDRIDRLLRVLAWACRLLAGIGRLARQRYRPGMWRGSNHPRQCSAFTIGKVMRARMKVRPGEAYAATATAIFEAAPNWG